MGQGTYFVFANPHKPQTAATAVYFGALLRQSGARVCAEAWLQQQMPGSDACTLAELAPGFAAVISVGGDGTILRTISWAARLGVPVLGINMGRIGFLLEPSLGPLPQLAAQLMAGEWTLEARMMLQCAVNQGEAHLAMNEIALTRGANPSSIDVAVQADGEPVFISRGDGVLAATPTGTTGYALSAGGPIVHPALSSITVVPICSHTMFERPLVLPSQTALRFTYHAFAAREAQLNVDGQAVIALGDGAQVDICRSAYQAKFIRFSKHDFMSRLLRKQRIWSGDTRGSGDEEFTADGDPQPH